MIKNLNMNIVKKDIGFHRREEFDYKTDSHALYKGYDYKDLPITTLRSDDVTYLNIDWMCYEDRYFTLLEFHETEECRLADRFYNVEEIDLDELIDTCERILAKINELNEIATSEVLDCTDLLKRIAVEIKLANDYITKAKQISWWDLEPYYMNRLRNSLKSLIAVRQWLREFRKPIMSDYEDYVANNFRTLREYIVRERIDGYVRLNEKSYECNVIDDMIEKERRSK